MSGSGSGSDSGPGSGSGSGPDSGPDSGPGSGSDSGPDDVEGGDAVLDEIDRLGVAYEVVPCDPDLADTAAFCAAYGFGLDESANAIVVVGKSQPRRYAACLVLANTRLDVNGVVRRRLGAKKASFASADETVELTGMRIGGVTPFGLAGKLPIWIDDRILALDRVIVGGGSRDRKLFVPPAALTALAGAEVVAALATPFTPA